MNSRRIRFRDRHDAGSRLAEKLGHLSSDTVVLGLPRGGVPVAVEVARALGAPLDVLLVRKLGVPFQPELAMGAIGEGGVIVRNEEVIGRASVSTRAWKRAVGQAKHELEDQRAQFRGDRSPTELSGRAVVIVDDGIATGSTVRAACQVVRHRGASRVIIATPVAPVETVEELGNIADEVVTVATPDPFFAIGRFYDSFGQVSEEEVTRLLSQEN